MSYSLEIKIALNERSVKSFILNNPTSVSRKIVLKENYTSSGAFHLPKFESKPFKYESGFIGDIGKGGSCNVNIISFCPHNLTHIETSSHITNVSEKIITIKDLEPETTNGLVYLIDCSSEKAIENNCINWEFLREKFHSLDIIPSIIALKTRSSTLPEHYDFSGKKFISLGQNVSVNIHKEFPEIQVIILDLPSADNEDDTQLMSHKEFFLTTKHSSGTNKLLQKAIVELAYFGQLEESYYYCMMSPAKIETDAIITDIIFWSLNRKN
jgi:kynurenine formamidase